MKVLEMLDEYPKAAVVVKQWFLDKMIDSLKDESLPDGFKEYVRQEGISNDKVGNMLEASPRALFDVFDNHKVFIEITIDENSGFWWRVNDERSTVGYEFRKNAERAAVEKAFNILNDKL